MGRHTQEHEGDEGEAELTGYGDPSSFEGLEGFEGEESELDDQDPDGEGETEEQEEGEAELEEQARQMSEEAHGTPQPSPARAPAESVGGAPDQEEEEDEPPPIRIRPRAQLTPPPAPPRPRVEVMGPMTEEVVSLRESEHERSESNGWAALLSGVIGFGLGFAAARLSEDAPRKTNPRGRRRRS